MSKIAGIKGRSLETYPNARRTGAVSTQSHVNPSSVGPLTTGLTSLLTAPLDVLPGSKAIVTYSGAVSTSGASVLVTVNVVVDGDIEYPMQVEVTSANTPAPFSLVFETDELGASPSPHTIDIQATASVGGDATVAANGSIVVVATAS